MLSILKKEITTYLSSMVAYVTIVVFLLVLGLLLWVFPDTSILAYGYAGLESLFSTAPYLFMFLVPAITMRTLAEERREGTFELLLTRPLTAFQIVMGKYLAGVLIVLFALLPTIIYYISVYLLGAPQGNIDTGAVIGSYIGLFLLGAVFTAIGLFASSVTKNQVISFTIAVFLCFFFYSGFGSLGGLLSLQNIGLGSLGIVEHYESVSRGVLDTRDLIYFLMLAALFLWLTLLSLHKQTGRKFINTVFLSVLGIIFSVSILTVFSNKFFTRFDFTKEKRFTISPISRKLLDSVSEPVNVVIYLEGDNFPGGMKRLQTSVRDMLSDLQAYSNGHMSYQFTDPLKDISQDEQKAAYENLAAKGIEGQSLSVKTDDGVSQKVIFPFALVTYGGRSIPVKLLQTQSSMGLSPDEVLNNSIQNLEYAFTSTIKKLVSGGKQRIGFTEGHGELTDLQLNDAMQSLSDGFLVGRVDLNTIAADSLQKVSLLIIPKPDKAFTEVQKFKIDQYLMRGGRILWAIDQVNAEMDSLRGKGNQQLAFPKQLNLDDQLFSYGIRINYDLIADLNCGEIPVTTGDVGGQPQIQLLRWLFYPVYLPTSTHPVVRNLDGIISQFANTIDVLDTRGVNKTVLLASSPFNKSLKAPHMLSLQALQQEPDPKEFQSTPKITGVLLEGQFTSAFRNRPVPEGIEQNTQTIQQSKPAKMIVLSDGDILRNQVGTDNSPYPLGYDRYSRQTYGNKNLLLNIADYMTDDSGLISLRSKEIKIRLLDRARIRQEKLMWQLINTVVPIAIVLIFAIFQHYMRRRKYAR
ncbi:gliding motility-associated ABC transporter substrate-binding protein GldG [Mucilaginibacter pallidiroseus]|uniref:Gliding motility-associated ABC transporter substrate-binding protein GldG n=1 Tax=Mucilaginibacter pallidiroseus TaxID=2599295 RepID=A0A563UDM3_9SPHI|nr:gliding motility-associated ABC transporter substrate-binding protein GldG [Mucilaginibacter pallidiroseus]TWR29416.1 gliding motility-associated ABC transporter substrate-binding protein GldG [Mucilaginibacter pallidiroseus]